MEDMSTNFGADSTSRFLFRAHMHAHACMHARMHSHMHARTHARAHAYTHATDHSAAAAGTCNKLLLYIRPTLLVWINLQLPIQELQNNFNVTRAIIPDVLETNALHHVTWGCSQIQPQIWNRGLHLPIDSTAFYGAMKGESIITETATNRCRINSESTGLYNVSWLTGLSYI